MSSDNVCVCVCCEVTMFVFAVTSDNVCDCCEVMMMNFIMMIMRIMIMLMRITMMLNLVKLGTADARISGLIPIKGLLDIERCVTLEFRLNYGKVRHLEIQN